MSSTNDNIHKGHRQRLKDKVRKSGLGILSEHEVLELMLTYTIPYKNTNPIAHELLKVYGSFSNVLDADIEDLKKINGVGEETSLFLSMLPSVFELYKKYKKQSEVYFSTTSKFVEYFRSKYEVGTKEKIYIFCLNYNYKLIKTKEFDGGNINSIMLDIRDFTENLLDKNTYSIILAHTHPDGDPLPSRNDINATKEIMTYCNIFKVKFLDHIIFTDDNYCSFKETKRI